MKNILLIGLGGFIGSISRYLLHLALLRAIPITFPIGTFVINMVGCLLLGTVYALAEYHKLLSNEWRLFLAIGFCGSFTTFSTFSFESLQLLQQKEWLLFGSYALGSVALGIAGVAAGYFILSRAL